MDTPTVESISKEINELERDVTTIAKALPMGGEILSMFARRTCVVLRHLNERVNVVSAAVHTHLSDDHRMGG